MTSASIHLWIDAKGLSAYKVGHFWEFKAAEVDGWVDHEGARNGYTRKSNVS